jgi:DNA segregation ATPase FtsK/SpoIIIE, S-DNA-T family
VEVRCDDPALEAHHALLVISAEGAALTQLVGRVVVHVDGRPADGTQVHAEGFEVEIAGSVLRVAPARAADAALFVPAHLRAGNVIRAPRLLTEWSPPDLTGPGQEPQRGPRSGGLTAALLGVAGAVVIAVVMRQPMFLIFAAVSGVIALGTTITQRTGDARRFRRARREHAAARAATEQAVRTARDEFIRFHLASTMTVERARSIALERSAELWERRGDHADAFVVSLGIGEVLWQPPVTGAAGGSATTRERDDVADLATLPDLPTPLAIGPDTRLAIKGPPERCRGMARALIVQLAANCGPADVRVVVVTQQPFLWQCLRGLPHAMATDGTLMVVDEAGLTDVVSQCEVPGDAAISPHLVVVTDAPELLAARTSPLRRLATSDRSPALVVLVDPDGGIPHLCTGLLQLTSSRFARWIVDTTSSTLPQQVCVAGVGVAAIRAVCASLSALSDPEDALSGSNSIPRDLGLASLLAMTNPGALEPGAIAATWLAAGPNPTPRAALGMAADGIVDIDLVRDGPHGLLAGTTGAGKSELLRSLVVSLAMSSSPDHLTFVLVDYKGGSTFDACAALPHVVGVVTDLDDRLADRALRSLHAELRFRERLLREHGAGDLDDLRRRATGVVLPRLVVVIDEFAALVSEQPDFLHALVGIAQRGRSLGVHLLLATQRPNGVISDDIRANTNLRVALRLQDQADAVDVTGDPAAALLPRGLPGRAIMRLGPDEYVTFQTARCTAESGEGGSDLQVMVDAIGRAAELVGVTAPRQPWLSPLPAELAAPQSAVALLDDPDRQSQPWMDRRPGDGHLLLAGAAGAGLTTALLMLGARAAQHKHPTAHLYVIDALGDDALRVFEHSPRCAGVVRIHERERLMRTLARVAAVMRERIARGGRGDDEPVVMLLVDGIDVLRRSLDDIDSAAELDALTDIVTAGAAVGVEVVMTTSNPTAVPSTMLAACSDRWVFRLGDPVDGTALGVAAADVPPAIAGRFVVVDGSTLHGLVGQVARRDLTFAPCVDGPVPAPIQCLPHRIDVSVLCSGGVDDGVTTLPLGLAFSTAATALLDVPDGDHCLVLGPSRSGKSTVLQRFAEAWSDVHRGDGSDEPFVGVVAPRRSPLTVGTRFAGAADLLDAVPAAGPVLLVVDDAELVDDVGGRLAAVASSRRPGLTIVAAGKPDALRQSYGHWTTVVRRSRIGVLAASSSDMDGDLLGVLMPRRLPVPPRPGLCYTVDNGTMTLVQVAAPVVADSPA